MTIKNIFAALILVAASTGIIAAEAAKPKKDTGVVATPAVDTLAELLQLVKDDKISQSRDNAKRVAAFRADRNKQRSLLNAAKAEQKREEDRTARLKAQYEVNDKKLAELEEAKLLKAGSLGEMIGVVRQVAGDSAARFRRSVITAQYPGRHEFLETLAQATVFPEIPEIRRLWVEIQTEMTEQSKVVKFTTEIVNRDGRKEERTIDRIGGFNLVSNGEYLVFNAEEQDINQLLSQPKGDFVDTIDPYQEATNGVERLAIDPSRGSILTIEVARESWPERVEKYAGPVGFAIFVVLGIGLLIVIERLFTLITLRGKMRAQAKSSTPGNNPLGRIMAVYLANKDDDTENLELKLDEAVLKETPRIERGITIIKVFAAVAPLMGLLGTVTGMIETFQSITLYGAGDPKVMAGGISSALITTVLGIVAALPLILLHSVVSGIAKGLNHMLEEQSTGLIAQHEEETGA
ncbi:MAG: MotA/TolQ/ExbB proton channel family protein [Kangiellaceae bacterium]|nr:MotA/TolQ/ExbB proton channel family protein [Kangiellaceae bacterium]